MTENRERGSFLESRHWQAVDASGNADASVDYLHHAASLLRERHREMLRPLEVTPAARCSTSAAAPGTCSWTSPRRWTT